MSDFWVSDFLTQKLETHKRSDWLFQPWCICKPCMCIVKSCNSGFWQFSGNLMSVGKRSAIFHHSEALIHFFTVSLESLDWLIYHNMHMFTVQQFWKDNFSGNKLSWSNLHYGYSLLIILMNKKGNPLKNSGCFCSFLESDLDCLMD